MKIKIVDVKENPLMKREELTGIIEHDGIPTPSRASVQKYLAKEKGINEKYIDIRKIFSASGREEAKLVAFIWKNKEVPVLEEKKTEKTKEVAVEEEKTEEKKPEEKKKDEKPKEKKEPKSD